MNLSQQIVAFSIEIDATYPRDLTEEQSLWRRCAKVSEESGEVIKAILGVLGENPRKGVTHTLTDLENELLDVACAALGAIAHLHQNSYSCDPVDLLTVHSDRVYRRLLAAIEAAS